MAPEPVSLTRRPAATGDPDATPAAGDRDAGDPGTDLGAGGRRHVDLPIIGMTCGACAARIETGLNRLDGVTATVNFATERASVDLAGGPGAGPDPGEVVAAIESMGYGAVLPEPAPSSDDAAGSDGPAARASAARRAAEAAKDREVAERRHRFLVSAALGVPVVILSMVPAWQFTNWQWLAFALASPVVVWGAWPFHQAAVRNLRHGAATMDTLISMGVTAAWAWSIYALFWGHAGMPGMTMDLSLGISRGEGLHEIYLEVAAGVTVFILAGRWLEARAKRRAGRALEALLDLGARDVAVLDDEGREQRVPVERLAVGDRFVVRPGEKIATDGVIVEGTSAIDRSLVTGESVPVEVGPGDGVLGATVNAGGRLVVRATRVGADTALAQMARLVEAAQSGKAPIQRLADRISSVFVPLVVLLAAGTLVAWLATGHAAVEAFTAAVAVLIIACPCALGLATPVALLVGTGRGAQLGIVIKGVEVLESTRRVDTIVLDKTGTVTTGRMALVAVVPAGGEAGDEVLRRAGAVEAASEHPVARAVAAAAEDRLGSLPAVTAFRNHPGLGAEALVAGTATGDVAGCSAAEPIAAGTATDDADAGGHHDALGPPPGSGEDTAGGDTVLVGRPGLLEGAGMEVPAELAEAQAAAEQAGRTAVLVGWGGRARGVLAVADTVRPTSATAIERLRGLGLHPVLLTGDNQATAAAVAAEVGIGDGLTVGVESGGSVEATGGPGVIAGVLPEDKVEVVRALQDRGRVVAMVGDGVNDAAALAQADLGLAMGSGTDVAMEASDLTLVRSDLDAAVDAIRLSRRTLRTIKGNLFWAFAYNVSALPLAALGYLNPLIAGAAMGFSSVFVVTNSLRLFRFRSLSG